MKRWSRPSPGLLATLAALAAPVVLIVAMVLPGMLGQQLFGAGDLIETQAPWRETTEVQNITNTCVSDTVDSRLPTMVALKNQLAEGDLTPLWDASASSGMSLAGAASQGVTSPLYVASLLASPEAAPAWLKFLEIATIVTGTFLWGRRIGLSRAASVLGGFLFATSGFMVMWTNWPHTRTAAFLPLLFWAIECIIQDRRVRSAFPLVIASVGLALGGFPAVAVFGVYAAAVYAVVRLVVVNRERQVVATAGAWLRPVALALLGGAVALAITAFQLLPWVQSLGATDLAYRQNQWQQTLGLREILTAAYPQALGTCASGTLRWGSVIAVEGVSFVGAGALVLCLAAVTLPSPSARMRGVRISLVVLGGLALAVSFVGGDLNYALQKLPLLGDNPLHRIRSVGGLMFAMLAAVGWDAIRRSGGRRSWLAWSGVALGPLLLLGAALAARRIAPSAAHWEQSASSVWFGLAVGVVVAACWAWQMARIRGGAVVAAVVVPAVVLAESLVFVAAFWPRTDPDLLYRDTATTDFLQENLGEERIIGVGGAYWWGGAAKTADLRSLTGHLFVPEEWKALLQTADPNMFITPTVHRLSDVALLESPVLDRFAVRYGVADMPTRAPGVVLTDGQQDPSDVRDLTHDVAEATVPAGSAVRGVAVQLTAPAVLGADGEAEYRAEVLNAAGEVVAAGSRAVRAGEAGQQVIPVVAESLADSPGEHTLRLWVDGGADVSVAGTGSGHPWLGPLVADADDTLTLVDAEDAQVYERTTALPRYRWAGNAEVCDTAPACAEMMGRVPDDTVLLAPGQESRPAMDGAPAEMNVVTDHDDRRSVDVSAAGAGMLVVADGLHEGWRATVDGTDVDIVRADFAMMGIPVPAGEHRVEIWYEPPGSPGLAVVAAVTSLGLAALWIGLTVRDRRRASVRGGSDDSGELQQGRDETGRRDDNERDLQPSA